MNRMQTKNLALAATTRPSVSSMRVSAADAPLATLPWIPPPLPGTIRKTVAAAAAARWGCGNLPLLLQGVTAMGGRRKAEEHWHTHAATQSRRSSGSDDDDDDDDEDDDAPPPAAAAVTALACARIAWIAAGGLCVCVRVGLGWLIGALLPDPTRGHHRLW